MGTELVRWGRPGLQKRLQVAALLLEKASLLER